MTTFKIEVIPAEFVDGYWYNLTAVGKQFASESEAMAYGEHLAETIGGASYYKVTARGLIPLERVNGTLRVPAWF